MNTELQRQIAFLTSKAKLYTGPKIRVRKKSSLSQIIKIKEQAEWFMKTLKLAEEDK